MTKAALIKAREAFENHDVMGVEPKSMHIIGLHYNDYETIRDLLDKAIGGEYVRVPREPTDAMLQEGKKHIDCYDSNISENISDLAADAIYRAMIAASGETNETNS